jgi:hypothetical protein
MRLLLPCLLLLSSAWSFSQDVYQIGLLPSINLNTGLPKDWKLNLKVESRQRLSAGTFQLPDQEGFDYSLTDFSALIAKKVGVDRSVAIGNLVRIQEGGFALRGIQQLVLTKGVYGAKLAHRFRGDQTFQDGVAPEFRLRYRLSTRVPLNGRLLDSREFFLKLNNEYLSAWQAAQYDLEVRLLSFIGFAITNSNKVELGVDYRLDSFLQTPSRHRWFGVVNWYLMI